MPVVKRGVSTKNSFTRPGRYHAGSQVAPEIPARVEGGSERDHRDQQHHPGAQGIGAKELPAFGNDVGLARQYLAQQLHPQRDA